jgi:hypothetical protein
MPPESIANSRACSPVEPKKGSGKQAREKRFRNLMDKVRVNGDAWIKKEMLTQIFMAQKEIGDEYVDLLSYFGGFKLN